MSRPLLAVLSVTVVLVIVFSVTNTKKSVDTKDQIDNCLELEKLIVQNPDASAEVYEQIEKCHEERARRLGLDTPGTGFLGNTQDPPQGALAHYESRGGINAFTVYEDRIEVNTSMGTPSGLSDIYFTDIEKIEKASDIPGTIYVILKSDDYVQQQYSLTLFGAAEAIRPEGSRDLDRLFNLLEERLSEYQ